MLGEMHYTYMERNWKIREKNKFEINSKEN